MYSVKRRELGIQRNPKFGARGCWFRTPHEISDLDALAMVVAPFRTR